MSKLRTAIIRTDFSLLNRAGQIGAQLNIPDLQARLKGFLSSPAGMKFVKDSLTGLTGKRWPNIKSVKAELFQQGYFQFIFRVKVQDRLSRRAAFCLVLSKGIPQMQADNITIDEYNNLQRYSSRYPEFFVEPLVLVDRNANGLVLYSSKFYSQQLEIDYKIDGLEGRNGLFINSLKVKNDCCAFSLEEQNPLLEEMIKILAVAYDENSCEAIEGLRISAGDFIVNYKDTNNFSMRLIAIRMTKTMDIPTFVCSLLNYYLGLKKYLRHQGMDHIGFPFDEITVFNGLAKAFQYKQNLSLEEANRKAANWMAEYHQALERGELDSYLRSLTISRIQAGFENLPRHYHKRGNG